MTSPQDRDAIKAWVDGNADRDKAKRVYDSLAKLPVFRLAKAGYGLPIMICWST